MTPAAQSLAVMEMIDTLLNAWDEGRALPADVALLQYLRPRRYIGSGDRRAITARVYTLLRIWGLVSWRLQEVGAPVNGRMLVLAAFPECIAECGQSTYAAHPISEQEQAWLAGAQALNAEHAPAADRANMPEWLHGMLVHSYGAAAEEVIASLHTEAPVVVRANLLATSRAALQQELADAGIESTPTAYSPWGLQLRGRVALGNLPAFREGRLEVQEESSQLAVLACEATPGMRVFDLCAGAGGKSLALAAMMQNRGEVIAADIDQRRLNDTKARAERAGATIISTERIDSEDPLPRAWRGTADVVLVDAPCTGTGTLRRNPDLAWRIDAESVARMHTLQCNLLKRAATLLKPNGRLVYTTCSLLAEENSATMNQVVSEKILRPLALEGQMWDKIHVELNGSEHFGLQLLPSRHGTDGFYIAACAPCSQEESNHE